MHSPELPQPILFHPLKHHLGYAKDFIRRSAAATEAEIQAALRTIGSSQLDAYTGQLTAQQIALEVIDCLQELQEKEKYRLYLAATGTAYSTITLSDGSDWVLRWGIVAGRHVHLHPARHARHTMRVKANTLKTAMATHMAARRNGSQDIDLQLVNQVRAAWLDLPPLQELLPDGGVGKLLTFLGA